MTSQRVFFAFVLLSTTLLHCCTAQAQTVPDERAEFIRANYRKSEVKIPMRDGVELFTSIYEPNDIDPNQTYPILLSRTPYSVGPYGLSQYKGRLGPSPEF